MFTMLLLFADFVVFVLRIQVGENYSNYHFVLLLFRFVRKVIKCEYGIMQKQCESIYNKKLHYREEHSASVVLVGVLYDTTDQQPLV